MAMNAVIGALRVVLGMDSASFEDGARSAEGRMGQMQRRMGEIGGAMQRSGAIMSAAITAPLVALAHKSIGLAGVQAQAVAAVDAVLASMGETAGFNSRQLQTMASALQETSTYGDEAILQKVTANLLTFGNIQGQVFADAQQMALDLSARLGTDLQSSAIMLGKALNDPAAGLTALTRVGVSFSREQQNQIRHMAAVGDVAGAQAVMMAELQRQYAGQAAAMAGTDAGKITQAMNAWGDALEVVGGILSPFVVRLADMLKAASVGFASMDPAMQRFAVGGAAIAAAVGPVVVGLGLMISAAAPVVGVLAALVSPLGLVVAALAVGGVMIWKNWESIGQKFPALAGAMRSGFRLAQSGARAFVEAMGKSFSAMAGALDSAVKVVDAIFRGDFSAAFEAAKGAARSGLSAIFHLVDGLSLGGVSRLSSLLRDFGGRVGAWAGSAFDAVADLWPDALAVAAPALAGLSSLVSDMGAGLSSAVDTAAGIVRAAWSGDWAGAWSLASDAAAGVADGVVARVKTLGASVSDQIGLGASVISAAWSGDWAGAWSAAGTYVSGLGDVIGAALDLATGGWSGKLADVARDALGSMRAEFVARFPEVAARLSGLWEQVRAVVAAWPGQFLEIGGQIVDGLRDGIAQKWQDFRDWLDGLGQSAIDGFRAVFDIHSPSKVMAGIGQNIVDGLMMGLVKSGGAPVKAMLEIARGVLRAGSVGEAFENVNAAIDHLHSKGDGVLSGLGRGLASLAKGATTVGGLLGGMVSKWGGGMVSSGLSTLSSAIGGGWGEFASGALGGLLGFANGGSFAVGGVGGVDSQLVAFRATPGELVDVRTPGQAAGGGVGGALDVRVTVDDGGGLRAFVENTADSRVAVRVAQANAALPARLRQVQRDPRRV